MRKLMLAGLLLMTVSFGCLLFDEPQGMDLNGNGIAGEKGWFSRGGEAAVVAGDAGIPFAGAVGALMAMIGAAGGHVQAARKTKKYAAEMVKLIDVLKSGAGDITSDADVERLVMEHASEDTAFGRYLKKAFLAMKAKGEV